MGNLPEVENVDALTVMCTVVQGGPWTGRRFPSEMRDIAEARIDPNIPMLINAPKATPGWRFEYAPSGTPGHTNWNAYRAEPEAGND